MEPPPPPPPPPEIQPEPEPEPAPEPEPRLLLREEPLHVDVCARILAAEAFPGKPRPCQSTHYAYIYAWRTPQVGVWVYRHPFL